LAQSGATLVLSRVKDPVRELLGRWDAHGLGADTRMFWSVDDAVHQSLSAAGRAPQVAPG
jgi:hypothetical protein